MNRRHFVTAAVAASSSNLLLGADTIERSSRSKNNKILLPSNATILEPNRLFPNEKPRSPKSKIFEPWANGHRIELCETLSSTVKTADSESVTECELVQVTKQQAGSVVTDPYDVVPLIKGSDEKPDVALSLQMDGFHLASDLAKGIGKKTRATMRITTSNNTGVSSPGLQTLYWAVSAGIDLYRQARKKEEEKAAVNQEKNLKEALSKPIELKDGLSAIQIQIIQHDEPPWWKEVFSWLTSSQGGGAIAEAFGYGAIAKPALQFIDNLFKKLDEYDSKPIIQSNFAPFAFSERGRKKYETGIKVSGRLNDGTWLLIKPTDFSIIATQKPYFYGPYGRLIPAGIKPIDFKNEIAKNPKNDPFEKVTYAVFSAELKEHKFDVT